MFLAGLDDKGNPKFSDQFAENRMYLSVDPKRSCRDDGALETRTRADDRDLTTLLGHGTLLSNWSPGGLLFVFLPEDHRALTACPSGAASA